SLVGCACERRRGGTPPAIVIGYVTPLVGSVYWNDQCGIVLAFARNCWATPPSVAKFAATSGFGWRGDAPAADTAVSERTSNASATTSGARNERLDMKVTPSLSSRSARSGRRAGVVAEKY